MLKNNVYMKSYLNIIKEDINVEKCQQIAAEIGGEYDIEINTIDCKENKVYFKNSWLNEEGSFDFKLINTSDDWSNMFKRCFKLTHLPDNFIIPDSVTNCESMFYSCKSLQYLPNNFKIPNNVKDCSWMFFDCESLQYLPDDFIVPDGVTDCSIMFGSCESLTHLPDNFTMPNSVKDCSYMFGRCKSLIKLPDPFSIPINADCRNIFDGCNKLVNKDSNAYKMWEI